MHGNCIQKNHGCGGPIGQRVKFHFRVITVANNIDKKSQARWLKDLIENYLNKQKENHDRKSVEDSDLRVEQGLEE